MKLHQATIDYIKRIAHDHFIKLSGTDHETRDWEESTVSANWISGGFNSRSREFEKVTFIPKHF